MRARLSERLVEFIASYGRSPSRAELRVEREVFGLNAGITSYTTPAQADVLGKELRLGPGVQLLDVGAGTGWPGLYLAKATGCHVTLTDVPAGALRTAAARAYKQRLARDCSFALASGTHLPFSPQTFDAVVHSDVL